MKDKINLNGTNIFIEKPDACNHCHSGLDYKVLNSYYLEENGEAFIYVTMYCSMCKKPIVVKYKYAYTLYTLKYFEIYGNSIGVRKSFDTILDRLNSEFVHIYNDAYLAKQNGLISIVGLGYRKALEHLIKDYLLYLYPDKRDEIIKDSLGKVTNLFDDSKKELKDCLKGTTYIGNDFTHYYKEGDETLEDLERFISVCVSKIVSYLNEEDLLKSKEEHENKRKQK